MLQKEERDEILRKQVWALLLTYGNYYLRMEVINYMWLQKEERDEILRKQVYALGVCL